MVCCCSCRSFTEMRRDMRKDALEVTVTSQHTGFLEQAVIINERIPFPLRRNPPESLVRITIEHTFLTNEQIKDMIEGCKKKKIVSLTLTDVTMTREQMLTLAAELPYLIEITFSKVFGTDTIQPNEPDYFLHYRVQENRTRLFTQPTQLQVVR